MASVVWVIPEADEHGLRVESLEALGEGRELATRLGGELRVIALGSGASSWMEAVSAQDVDAIERIEHPLLGSYSAGGWVGALSAWLPDQPAGPVLIPATARGQDYAARLAARLNAPFAGGCVWAKAGPDGDVRLVQPVCEGRYHATFSAVPSRWVVVTLQPGAIGQAAPIRSRAPRISVWQPALEEEQIPVRQVEFLPGDPTRLDLRQAEVVVAGGRGAASEHGWQSVTAAAQALEAVLGGSRMALDLGYIPRSRMIGQTGAPIRTRLYLSAGISGVSHHTGGVQSEHWIAIDTDRHAPIFNRASLGIVGDLNEILPRLAERVRRERMDQDGGPR